MTALLLSAVLLLAGPSCVMWRERRHYCLTPPLVRVVRRG